MATTVNEIVKLKNAEGVSFSVKDNYDQNDFDVRIAETKRDISVLNGQISSLKGRIDRLEVSKKRKIQEIQPQDQNQDQDASSARAAKSFTLPKICARSTFAFLHQKFLILPSRRVDKLGVTAYAPFEPVRSLPKFFDLGLRSDEFLPIIESQSQSLIVLVTSQNRVLLIEKLLDVRVVDTVGWLQAYTAEVVRFRFSEVLQLIRIL